MKIDSDKRLVFLITILSPITGLFLAFRWRYMPWAKNLFWIFCSFTGLVIIYTYSEGYDIYRYAMQLKDFFYSDISFNDIFQRFFTQEDVDIYQLLLAFLTSRFTDNAHLLFFLYAFIYGFFYSRNIWYIYEKKNNHNKSYHIGILILYVALIWPVWQIAGARFGTAFHMFVYGALPYIFEKDKSKMVFLFLSPLIHFSFLFPIAVFLIYLMLPRKQLFVIVFYVITLFIREINIPLMNELLTAYLPSFLHSRVNIYANEAYLMRLNEVVLGFHVTFMNYAGHIVIQILLFCSYYILVKFIKTNDNLHHLFCFSLLLGSFSNIFSLIPNGGRFSSLSQLFIVISIIFIFSELKLSDLYRKRILPIAVFLLIPVVFKIRVGCDYYGLSLLGNFITAFFIEDSTPVIEFIK